MAGQATVLATAKIDISPDGIKITFEGIDSDLASLMSTAVQYIAEPSVYRSYDTSDLVVKSEKIIQFVYPPNEGPSTA